MADTTKGSKSKSGKLKRKSKQYVLSDVPLDGDESLEAGVEASHSSPIDLSDAPDSDLNKEAIPVKNKRGPTKLKGLGMAQNEIKEVEYNERGQPIGDNSITLASFLGALVRSTISINEKNWSSVSKQLKEDMWIVVLQRYKLDEVNKKDTLQKMRDYLRELCIISKREPETLGKPLFRKAKDGRIFNWNVEQDDSLCTLQESFEKVNSSLGFNIELKFDNNIVYPEEELTHVLQAILQVVFEHARERPIIFSTFQPDAAIVIRKLQNTYPVFFLTNGGCEVYTDVRRNSLEEAMKLCLNNGLQGIVSAVKGIFRNPGMITRIKESNISLFILWPVEVRHLFSLSILSLASIRLYHYLKLRPDFGYVSSITECVRWPSNVAEAVYMQHLMGVDGMIVDLVQEITEAVSDIISKPEEKGADEQEDVAMDEVDGQKTLVTARPNFSQRELSFLLI